MSTQPPPLSRIPWPPLLYGGGGLLAWLANQWFHLPLPNTGLPGLILAAGGISLDLWAMVAFRKYNTTILPTGSATRLITSGPFAWSRNPIYVGNTALLTGLALYFQNPWMLTIVIIAAFVTQKLAIEREEKYLAAKFGEDWSSYAAKTPRWLFF